MTDTSSEKHGSLQAYNAPQRRLQGEFLGEVYLSEGEVTLVSTFKRSTPKHDINRKLHRIAQAILIPGLSVGDLKIEYADESVAEEVLRLTTFMHDPSEAQEVFARVIAIARNAVSEKVKDALEALESAIEESQREEWQNLLAATMATRTLDENQVAQVSRHAEMRRTLKDTFTFYSSQEFAEFAPGVASDSNITRSLTKAVTERKEPVSYTHLTLPTKRIV